MEKTLGNLKQIIKISENYLHDLVYVKTVFHNNLFTIERQIIPDIDNLEEEEILSFVLENYEKELSSMLISKYERILEDEIIGLEDCIEGSKLYKVHLSQIPFLVISEFRGEEEALERLCAYLANNNYNGLFTTIEEYENMDEDDKENYIYVDFSSFTENDIKCVYLDGVYTHIDELM